MPIVAPLALQAALLAAAAPPSAATSPIALELTREPGAERCPDRDSLAAEVGRRLMQTGSARPLPVADKVSIAIARTPAGHRAIVTIQGLAGGVRVLADEGKECAGLAEALVLTLSMIADGQPAPAPKVALAPATPPPSRPARPWQVGAGALGSTGILGTSALGATVDGIWHPWPRLATGLSVLWMPSRTTQREAGTTSVSVVAGLGRVCGGLLPFGGPAFPALCAVVGAGLLHGDASGYVAAHSTRAPWLVAGGAVDLDVRLGSRFSLNGRAGYLFSLRDASFTIGGLGQVYDSGHPGWTAELGVLVRIP